MQQYRKNLGKVSLTAEGAWDRNKEYEILSIVYDENTNHAFVSRKDIPKGVDLYNKKYWMPFNVSGYADNNIILLSQKTSESSIESYTLEEAIKTVTSVGRRPGAILGFYNENTDRLDIGGRWELWQYNGVDIADWENVNSWDSIYYNYNKFVGWYRSEEALKKYVPFPEIGCYGYIGSDLNEAVIYRCDRKYAWTNTTEHVWDYVKVIVGGNVTVGENGNWFNNGVDTNIPASIKGENGKTPIIRNNDNILEVSYDNVKWTKISDEMAAWFRVNNNKLEMSRHEADGWEVMSDYIAAWFRWQSIGGQQATNAGKIQITRDGVTWTDLTGEFVNNLHISRYIGADESLPTSGIAEGTIYAKGPYYAEDDTLNDNPIYRLWVYAWKDNTLAWQDNGEFTSIAAGIVQETGNSETEVMSQKATTEKLTELTSKQITSTSLSLKSKTDNSAINANDGSIVTDETYMKHGTVYEYELQSNSITNVKFISPAFNKVYATAALYKNGELYKMLGLCNNAESNQQFNVINKGIDVVTLKICVRSTLINKVSVSYGNIADDYVTFDELQDILIKDKDDNIDRSEIFINGTNNSVVSYTTIESNSISATVGNIISLVANQYRNVGKIDVSKLYGMLSVENIMSESSLIGLVVCDSNNIVVDIVNVWRYEGLEKSYVNLSAYTNAKYVYFMWVNTEPIVTILGENGLRESNKQSIANMQKIDGVSVGEVLPYTQLIRTSLKDVSIGEKLSLTGDKYVNTGFMVVNGRIDTLEITRIFGYNNLEGIVLTNYKNEVIEIIWAESLSAYSTLSVELSKYKEAYYLYFVNAYNIEPYPSVKSLGVNGVMVISSFNKELEYDRTNGKAISTENVIGGKFASVDDRYRSLCRVSVNGLGRLKITNVLGYGGFETVLVDSEGIVVDIVSNSSSNSYIANYNFDLSDYPTVTQIYFVAAPVSGTNYEAPVVTNYYTSINDEVKQMSSYPNKGVVILHFDGIEENGFIDNRRKLIESYGLKASGCINKGLFLNNDNEFTEWKNEEVERQYWDAVKAGWDFGVYPSEIAGNKTKDEWDEYMKKTSKNLANKGIHNVTAWMCGRLDVNDDLLNAAKDNNYKILRGGGANDSLSTDTYEYTDKNLYMPLKSTSDTMIVNKSLFVSDSLYDIQRITWHINYAIQTKTAVSAFTHLVLDELPSGDGVNCSKAFFIQLLEFIKQKVDEGKLQVMTWREYYAYVNPIDGHENDYNRIVKMINP